MSQFLTGKALDDKLTSIIWEAKKELIILSPFIRLDAYSKEMFKNYTNNPSLELIIVFGKNETDTKKSLPPEDLDFFKQFHNVVIIYCANLHAKFYANENEGLVTSLNLLGKSMTGNVEYGIAFSNGTLNMDKLYKETYDYTNKVIQNNPCIFVKRPVYIKTNLGLSKKFISSKIIYDKTNDLYQNKNIKELYYDDFEYEIFDSDVKMSREEFDNNKFSNNTFTSKISHQKGFCIRCEAPVIYSTDRPYCKSCFSSWNEWQNYDYKENVCHCCGKPEKTTILKPECYSCFKK
ncbi:hypothetical protein GOQ30_03500 [Flavobacterium sp. TP390]|uniref:Phospholipase D-like domain-containing protein n=1 Tax=Flavobacterium profundi TaxID=1774945 RepID=A0A6I4IJQ8_9FLAO|nr:phospholipase D family protein [Flavobacterium profundi]MVO08229.1 hypothetical protein [Flavobacterium profundi]